MRERRLGDIIVLAVAGFAGGFIFLAYTDFALIRANWCTGAETQCAREWIAALSGWAAAIVAGVTIVTLYSQIEEQRKQTTFALGFDLPTMSASHPQGRMEDLVLRVVNWNRHHADIQRVRVIASSTPIEIALDQIQLGDANVRVHMDPEIRGIVRMAGWENRSSAPPTAEIYVHAHAADAEPDEIIQATFAVDLVLYSEQPQAITVKADINLRL